MSNMILELYKQLADGRYVIGINAGKTSDLYNDFDKHMPYVRKELDQDLVEYISDSARDLYKEDFIYLKTLEIMELSRIMRTSLLFLVIGMALLFLSILANEELTAETTVITKVFAGGLTVAAWVSLWEALATFIVNWTPFSRKIKLYDRIANAPVDFL